MISTGQDNVFEWTKDSIETCEVEVQTTNHHLIASHTQTDTLTYEESFSQTEASEQDEFGTQTLEVETQECAVQTSIKSFAIETQTEASDAKREVDCQTDEILIKEKTDVEVEYKSTFV